MGQMQYGKQFLKKVPRVKKVRDPVMAVCEIPAGSRCKYELDKRSGYLKLGQVLPPGFAYPTDYGFVPNTLGSDETELDILILSSEPLMPLTLVRSRILGGFTLQEEGRLPEHLLVAVAEEDPALVKLETIADCDPNKKTEIEQFFTRYKLAEDIAVRFLGWADRAEALVWLRESLDASS